MSYTGGAKKSVQGIKEGNQRGVGGQLFTKVSNEGEGLVAIERELGGGPI